MTIQRTGLAMLAVAAMFATTANAQMVHEKKVITSEAARKIAEGCEAYAKSKGWHVSVWVLDETLTPLYFYRMVGTPLFTVKRARMKAERRLRSERQDAGRIRGNRERDCTGLRAVTGRIAHHDRRPSRRRNRDRRLDG